MIFVLIIGILCGFVFLVMTDESSKEIVYLNINNYLQDINNIHINNIIYHLIIISTIFILSIFFIGIPIGLFYLFYNGFSIGFIITALSNIFGINGFIYGLIYIAINKLLYVILLILFFISLIRNSKMILDRFIKKNTIKDKNYIFSKRCIIYILLMLANDILLYFIGIPLLKLFHFLII